MVAKTVGLLFVSFAMARALPALPLGIAANQLQDLPSQSINYVQQAVGEAAKRATNAYVTTFDQQKDSIDQTFENVKITGQKGVESTLGLLKNGLEFIFILPKFGRNVLANPQPQSTQQQLEQLQQLLQTLQVQQQQILHLQQAPLQQIQQQFPQRYN